MFLFAFWILTPPLIITQTVELHVEILLVPLRYRVILILLLLLELLSLNNNNEDDDLLLGDE